MGYVSGNDVTTLWTVLDVSGDPLTGITDPGDIAFTLHRESGATMVAAGESVTFTEIGVTGHYFITFTPTNTGLYVLQLKEIAATTLQRTARFDYGVVSAGSVFSPTFANAFCAETDIERWLQQTISGTSNPSSTEAAGFAEARASVLMSLMEGAGKSITPTTITADSRLEDILREANAVGAALDYTIAQSFGKAPSRTERIPELLRVWLEYYGDKDKVPPTKGIIEREVGVSVSLSTDHIISGDTTAAATTQVISEGIQIGMGDTY